MIVLWSAQGPVAVERSDGLSIASAGPEGRLRELLAGPTAEERAQGLRSAIPAGTSLVEMVREADDTVVVRLAVPEGPLETLDHGTFEAIVRQIGGTLDAVGWRELRLEARDPVSGAFVPLAQFLPSLAAPRKETSSATDGPPAMALQQVDGPPASGQGQPPGGLSGKTIYVSAGHGWLWNDNVDGWRTQRPPYPYPPYEGPIIEDHNNAEIVNQYLLQYLWNAGAMVWPVRERDMNDVSVTVDNDQPGADSGYTETGSWTTTSATGTGHAGTDYRWAATVTGEPTATAVWTATLPADGAFAVYAWYRHGSNRAPDAHYTVHHAGGETVVTVDQRRHGDTWHYLGTYGFRAGEEARVTLSNRSRVAGRAVIADAVRIGGGTFDDLSGIETAATHPPDKPWWEVAAFYHAQRMGMERPPGDVTARPIYARWEHAGSGDDAVYVSWHTNGVSGYQTSSRGTISIMHNGAGAPVTPGSETLRDVIHDELVRVFRAGWDSTWPGYKRRMNLGELRALWDEEPDTRIPGALFEIAYHDHPGDTDALKEPRFARLAARAMYQGLVKYFEQRDGSELTLLPTPPTHLAVRNVGAGQVRIDWRPSPADTLDLVGDPATGYRVYTSTNGVGWSDGAPVTGTTAYTLTGLTSGRLLHVRVTATNDGGESFPTEALSVRVGDAPDVVLVNGFDRLNRAMTVLEDDPVEGENRRMLLDRMNRYDYVTQHGATIFEPFDSASNEAVVSDSVQLGDYAVVDWLLGEESVADETLSDAERDRLEAFLDGGGGLFISGTELGWHLNDLEAAPHFYHERLRADHVADDAETYTVAPVDGALFAGLAPFRFDAPGMYDPDYPDQIAPLNGSQAALSYQGGAGGMAALQYADELERIVYLGFPFETIWPEQREPVMERVLTYLMDCTPPSNARIRRAPDGDLFTGNRVRFTAAAEGEQPFNYAWSMSGEPVGGDKAAWEHVFEVPGTYTVAVTISNAGGQTRATRVVEVRRPLEGQPDLSQSHGSVNLTSVEAGDILTYTLLLRNQSPVPATAHLTDTIPAHTRYVSDSAWASDGAPVTLNAGAIRWSGQVISGTPVVIAFAVEVQPGLLPGDPIKNVARVDDGLGDVVLLETRSTYDPGYSVSINDGALYTNIPTVTLSFSWRDLEPPVTWMKVSNDGGFGASSGWLDVDLVHADWALETYESKCLPRTVYAMFRASDGRQYGPVQDDIIYDPNPPRVVSVEVSFDGHQHQIQSLGAATGMTSTVRVVAEDGGSGVEAVHLSRRADFASFTAFDVDGGTTEIPWSLPVSGKVYVRVADRAGNVSAVETQRAGWAIYLPLVVRQ
jgi:uncharacterized repeat protein (TIGR01451 family)